uniref:Tyrosine-protein phosphatase non-receptor type 61F n=1 Tax=Caenorhabditis tropicalis TaxID=1561998 RepID=A0A1I7TPU6_9PELO
MSEVTTPSALDGDQQKDETGTSEPKSKTPPPLPSFNPIVKEPAGDTDLIQFENDEERAATVSTPTAVTPMETESAVTPEAESKVKEALQKFIDDPDTTNMDVIAAHFVKIRQEQEKLRLDHKYRTNIPVLVHNFFFNRYRDILPYDENRIIITKSRLNSSDGYINASPIQLPLGKTSFIAAQAPLLSTLEHWWTMIDEHGITLVIILCKLMETNKVKCERYWPEAVGGCEVYGDYEITLEEEKYYDDDEYMLRILTMVYVPTKQTRRIHQLHYREWPDHGCPSGQTQLLNMIEIMDSLREEVSPNSPMLVHCSAGVGRTGTIIAINHIRELIKAGTLTTVDLPELVMSLRRQRGSMVQTIDQYEFVNTCIHIYARRYLGLPEPPPKYHFKLPATPECEPVKLIAPPTPTASTEQPQANVAGYQPDPVDNIVEDEVDAASVPDFPEEPPAPTGPEDLGDSAAN